MESQRIKYIRELKKTKLSLEKQVLSLDNEIKFQREQCEHFGILFGDDTFRCLKCGEYEPSDVKEVIKANNLHYEDFDLVQDTLLEMLDENPDMKTKDFQEKVKILKTTK